MLRPRVGAALLAVQIFFGVHYFTAKLALGMVPPRAWASIRIAGAAVVMLAWQVVIRRRGNPARRDLPRLALYAFFGIVLNQILFAEGLARTTPSHSAILNSLIPVMTLGFALLARHEGVTRLQVLALTVSLASVLVLLRVENFRLEEQWVAGDLLTLANGASFSLYLVISRNAMRRLDPIGAITWILGFGAVGILAFGAPVLLRVDYAAVPLRFWALAAYAILFATVLAYALNAYALAHTDSSMVALFIYLQPPIATALSMVFLHERPDTRFWLAAAGVFTGVGLAVVDRRRGTPQLTIRGPSGRRPENPAS